MLTVLILLLLFMNGTIWEESSITNYQYNATGVALFVILGLIGLIDIGIACLWFLSATSTPTFTVSQLQLLVRKGVHDFQASKARYPTTLEDAEVFYQSLRKDAGPTIRQTDKEMIEAKEQEDLFDFLAHRVILAYPHMTIPHARWGFQYCGGMVARQRFLLLNGREYLCIWGTTLPQSGSSGIFPDVLEGDVIIKGEIQSHEPESKRSLVRTYRFGDTSYLRNGVRRHCLYSKDCWMISFGLHVKTDMFRAAFTALLLPFWLINYDYHSFWIQAHDFVYGYYVWLCARLYLCHPYRGHRGDRGDLQIPPHPQTGGHLHVPPPPDWREEE